MVINVNDSHDSHVHIDICHGRAQRTLTLTICKNHSFTESTEALVAWTSYGERTSRSAMREQRKKGGTVDWSHGWKIRVNVRPVRWGPRGTASAAKCYELTDCNSRQIIKYIRFFVFPISSVVVVILVESSRLLKSIWNMDLWDKSIRKGWGKRGQYTEPKQISGSAARSSVSSVWAQSPLKDNPYCVLSSINNSTVHLIDPSWSFQIAMTARATFLLCFHWTSTLTNTTNAYFTKIVTIHI